MIERNFDKYLVIDNEDIEDAIRHRMITAEAVHSLKVTIALSRYKQGKKPFPKTVTVREDNPCYEKVWALLSNEIDKQLKLNLGDDDEVVA